LCCQLVDELAKFLLNLLQRSCLGPISISEIWKWVSKHCSSQLKLVRRTSTGSSNV
jgi:hypothetical protein